MSLSPGQVLGRYRLLEAIDRGGMGEVYRAHDTQFNRDVAIKSIAGPSSSRPELLRRFAQEVADAPRVVHPYVATVFDLVEHEGAPLLVMEYVKGRRFDVMVEQDRPDPSRIARYGQEIAEALVAIHGAGLVHRDLKPGNVMITEAGHVKVMDFGVAGRTPPADPDNAPTESVDAKLTQPGAVIGTPAYMSPEQLMGRTVDGRSDLFALGIMLFEAITGDHPFRGNTAPETAAAILHRPPGSPEARQRLEKTGPLERAVLALLEKDPANRPPDATQAARRLHDASRELTVLGPGVVPERRWAPLVAGIAALLALGLLFVVYRASIAPRPAPRPGLPRAPAVPGARPAVAVLPFEFRADAGESAGRGAMVADLVAATLGETGRLRSVAPDRISEALAAGADTRRKESAIDRVRAALAPDWLVTGTLYREEGELLATLQIYRGSERDAAGSFRVQAQRSSELAERAVTRLLEVTGAPLGTAFPAARPAPRFAADDDAQLLLRDARRMESQSDYAGAIARLEEAIRIDPRFVDAQVLLADLRERIGLESRARETMQEAMRRIEEQGLAPDSRQVLQAAAVQGRLLGLPAGLESLRKLAQLYPDEPDTLLRLATALLVAGKEDEALTPVDRAAALDPLDVRPLRVRGQILMAQGKLPEARALLDRAERRYRELGFAAGLAEILEAQGYLKFQEQRYEEAAADYRQATDRFEAAGLPIRALGDIQSVADMNLKLWRLDEAEAGYRRTLSGLKQAGHYSQVVDTLSGLGGLLLRRRKLDEAETILREADSEAQKLGKESLRVAPLVNLAWVCCYSGRRQEAADLARKGREIAQVVGDAASVSAAEQVIATADWVEGKLAEAARKIEEMAAAEGKKGDKYRQGQLLGVLAEIQEQSEQPGRALGTVNRAIQLMQPSGPGAELANRYGCRARVLAQLGRPGDGAVDLGSAETMTTRQQALPQVRDMLTWTRATLHLLGGKAGAVLDDVSMAPGTEQRASLARGPAEILRAQAQLLSGDAAAAEESARKVQEHPWASATDKASAGLVRARALATLDRGPDALKEARATLDAARKLGLSLSQAELAAVMLRVEPRAPDATHLGRLGREQIGKYLDAIPPDARETVRARFDIKEALEILGR